MKFICPIPPPRSGPVKWKPLIPVPMIGQKTVLTMIFFTKRSTFTSEMEIRMSAQGVAAKRQPTLLSPERSPEPEQLDDAPKILCTPYIRGLSEKIKKVWAPLGVKPVFRPRNTLKRELMQVKNRTPEQSRIVPNASCGSAMSLKDKCWGVYSWAQNGYQLLRNKLHTYTFYTT